MAKFAKAHGGITLCVISMNIFNPEHDLCLANGDPNFVPPESALRFGRECAGLNSWIETGDGIIPWGWDAVLKRRLIRDGISPDLLPSDRFLENVKMLSHRRNALHANDFLLESLPCLRQFADSNRAFEAHSCEDVLALADRFGDAVAKAPWSGSGKGLRWLRAGELSENDLGWCRNVLRKQGSVIIERRENVARDFAMLFSIFGNEVRFEGMSLFFNENGMYKGNVLGSDEWILSQLSAYLPREIFIELKDALAAFFRRNYLGVYQGYLGVDMFIFKDAAGSFRIAPCVEINARMTMGLLARRVFDRHLDYSPDCGLRLVRDIRSNSVPSGRFVLRMDYSPSGLRLPDGAIPLAHFSDGFQYAVIVYSA